MYYIQYIKVLCYLHIIIIAYNNLMFLMYISRANLNEMYNIFYINLHVLQYIKVCFYLFACKKYD